MSGWRLWFASFLVSFAVQVALPDLAIWRVVTVTVLFGLALNTAAEA